MLPLPSNTVILTVLSPISSQVNVLGSTVIVSTLQLSVELIATKSPVIVTFPFASKATVVSFDIQLGSTKSNTVIFALQSEEFPLPSVNVTLTVCTAPRSEQSNESSFRSVSVIPQASLLPLFISSNVIDAFPFASRLTVKSCTRQFGAIVSATVTIASQVSFSPVTLSVTINCTSFVPKLLQSNESGFASNETSFDPPHPPPPE